MVKQHPLWYVSVSADKMVSSHAIALYEEGYALMFSINSRLFALKKHMVMNEHVIESIRTVQSRQIDDDLQQSLCDLTATFVKLTLAKLKTAMISAKWDLIRQQSVTQLCVVRSGYLWKAQQSSMMNET